MLKKLLYIVIVIIAFVLGHNYGENTVSVIEDLPIPTITIEMPSNDDTEIETPDLDIDGKLPTVDLDASLPSAEVKGPDLEISAEAPTLDIDIEKPSGKAAGKQRKRRKGIKAGGRTKVPRPKRG